MRAVAYYRVSTQRQGVSGLGLEAQQAAVRAYLTGKGWPPVAEHTEVESGKRNDRPELAKAMAACRVYKATLVIAKLDRLARNAAFLLSLRDAGVEFTACDMPDANRLTVGILACVAEHEAEMISARTKAALAAAKVRGTKLGGDRGYRPGPELPRAGREGKAKAALARAERLRATVVEIQAAGIAGPAALARELNARGITTDRGGQWQTTQAARLLARLAPARRRRKAA